MKRIPLKRTPLKRKTPLRQKTSLKAKFSTKVKRKTKSRVTLHLPTIKSLKIKIWNECKRITRARYGNVCYTSGQTNLEGSNWQTGHGVPKGSLPLRYQFDLRNLRPQSYNENINRGGNSHVFLAKLEREKEGLEFLNEVCYKVEEGYWKVKNYETMGTKDAQLFLIKLLEEYKKL